MRAPGGSPRGEDGGTTARRPASSTNKHKTPRREMARATGEETREKERLTCLAVGRTREDRTGSSRDEEKALNKMQPSFMEKNHHHPENVPKLSQSGSVKPYDSSHTGSTSHCRRHEEETRRLQTRKGDTRQPGGRCCGLSVRKLPNDLRESLQEPAGASGEATGQSLCAPPCSGPGTGRWSRTSE